MRSWLEKARRASELSPEDCASALGCSRATYESRENAPGNVTLDELGRLRRTFDDRGLEIMREAVADICK